MRVENRARAEKTDSRNDLRGDARRIAVRPAVRREADLGDGDRQVREDRRADADEEMRTAAARTTSS